MLKMIDLFSGAGGLSEGLRQAGFHSLYANEIMKTYSETYALNHPHTIVDQRDIRTVDAHEVRSNLGLRQGELDLIAGGPPCQGFSINAPMRTTDDARNHLFREFIRFVDEFQPKAVLIENVPGLVSFENGMTLQAILYELHNHGYYADVRILYAPHYGVPQTRWRTIIIGMKNQKDIQAAFPQPEYDAPRLSKINLERLAHIPAGGNWTNIPIDLLPKGMQRARKSDHTKRYGRVSPDGLASTILTKCDPHWGAYFHYSQDRVFSVREADTNISRPFYFYRLQS